MFVSSCSLFYSSFYRPAGREGVLALAVVAFSCLLFPPYCFSFCLGIGHLCQDGGRAILEIVRSHACVRGRLDWCKVV
ncbi:hypothetical protein DENSPDRAFT_343293 [Dentipellis sp. KUC8613]|nr:hypothetical protein DENSPDRAFT_343293 [Dentipellis sp. KUC8613]